MVAGQCKERIQALSLWCPAPDLVYNLKKHLTLCGQDVSNIEKDGCADVEGLKLSLKFYQDACTLDPYKEASLFDKNVCTIHGDQDITASCEYSYKYKEHRFKSFVFREARMKGALDFLKDELL